MVDPNGAKDNSEHDEVSEAKEKANRERQSSMKFWKIEYDFFKHIMTLSLAALAAFGAMLGGAFDDPTSWQGDHVVWFLSLTRTQLIYYIFSCFAIAAIGSALSALLARTYIHKVGVMETATEIEEFYQNQHNLFSQRVVTAMLFSILPFGLGILGLLIFVSKNI